MNANAPLPPPRLLPLGDAAWTVEFGTAIHPDLHARVLGLCRQLEALSHAGGLPGVIEWAPAFRSVSVFFDPEQADALALRDQLAVLAGDSTQGATAQASGRRWYIPVCFDADCAPDLAEVAALKALTPEAVVQQLTQTVFTVYMLGFLPGFPYLGGLPEALDLPRLASPRKSVPARSIAIAGTMCAAYPWESPGGWRLVGRTPVRLFDPARSERPALLAPGDEVCWQAVDRASYDRLDRAWASGRSDRDLDRLHEPGATQ